MPRATIGGLGLAGQDLEGPTWSPNLIRKTQFCGGIVSKLKMRGLPVTRMDCMVPRRPLGKPVSPQTPFKKWFPSTFPNLGKFREGPLAPLYISYGPFVAPTGGGGMAEGPLY